MSLASVKPLLAALADGKYHSGESLGQALGVSRAAVWKQIQILERYGLSVTSTKGLGYCLAGGVDRLDASTISAGIARDHLTQHPPITVLDEIDSTNAYLFQRECEHGELCLAEYQSAGKGRRGRQWVSPYGSNIYLSMCMRTHAGVAAFEGLSLAVGVVVAQALESLGVQGIRLKWPNDLFFQNKKLGGILIEVGGDLAGECKAIIGLGLNVSMPNSEVTQGIDQPWIDLHTILAGNKPMLRNALCIAMINSLTQLAVEFEQRSFAAYQQAWLERAAYVGEAVILTTPGGQQLGYLRGVDTSGGLILASAVQGGDERVFTGGEISLRAAS